MIFQIFVIIILIVLGILSIVLYVKGNHAHHECEDEKRIIHYATHVNGFRVNQIHFPTNMDTNPFMKQGIYSFETFHSPPHGVLDLRPKCPPVYNQGFYGDCTNQSTCFLVEYYCNNVLKRPFKPSRWLQNFFVQRFWSNDDGSIIEILLNMYGSFQKRSNTGGATVDINIATMMMFGMVDEAQFPFPTLKEADAHLKTLQHLHKEEKKLTTLIPKTQTDVAKIDTQFAMFIQKYNTYISTLPLPSATIQKHALNTKVSNCIAIDAHSIDDIRKCLYYKGPLAFSLNLPYWFWHKQNPLSTNTCIAHYISKRFKNTFTKDENIILNHLPEYYAIQQEVSKTTWSSILFEQEVKKK